MRRRLSFLLFVALAVAALHARPSAAAGLEELTVYPFVQYFTWEEFDRGGQRLLKESGPQYGAGTHVRVDLVGQQLYLQAKAELFGGEVNYDGMTQTNPQNPAVSEIPVNTDVTYFGTRLEADVAPHFGSGHAGFEPFAGLGYRWWLRDLQDSVAADRNGHLVGVGGYTEEWQTLYTKLGLRAFVAPEGNVRFFAEGGAKYPLLVENRVDFSDSGKLTLKPGKEWTPFAEVGARFNRFRASFYYEGFRYSESPPVSIGGGVYVVQPKTDSDIFGVTFGWCFR